MKFNNNKLFLITLVSLLVGLLSFIPYLAIFFLVVLPVCAGIYGVSQHKRVKSFKMGLYVGAISGAAAGLGYFIGTITLTIILDIFSTALDTLGTVSVLTIPFGDNGFSLIIIILVSFIIYLLVFPLMAAISGSLTALTR